MIPLIQCAMYIRVSRVGNSCWVILETNSTCPQPVLSVSRHSGSHNNSHAEHVKGLDDPLKARQSPSAHLIHGSLLGGALVFATYCLKQLGEEGTSPKRARKTPLAESTAKPTIASRWIHHLGSVSAAYCQVVGVPTPGGEAVSEVLTPT